MSNSFLRSRWMWLLAVLGLLVLATLLAAPHALHYAVTRFITDHGGESVQIERTEFNPFTRRARLVGLTVASADMTLLAVGEARLQFGWFPLIRKRFDLQSVHVSNLELLIEELPDEGGLRIGGISAALLGGEPEEDERSTDASSPWGYSVQEFEIRSSRLRLLTRVVDSTLAIEALRVARVATWQPQEISRLDFSGTLDGAAVRIHSQVTPFSATRTGSARIHVADLDLGHYEKLLPPEWTALQGTLSTTLRLRATQQADLSLNVQPAGVLSLKRMRLESPQAAVATTSLVWEGRIELETPAADTPLRITADSDLDVTDLDLSLPGQAVTTRHQALTWDGSTQYSRLADAQTVDIDGALNIRGTRLANREMSLDDDNLQWTGKTHLALTASTTKARISGTTTLSGLTVNLPDDGRISEASIAWDGALELTQTGRADPPDFRAEGQLRSKTLAAELRGLGISAEQAGILWDGVVSTGSAPPVAIATGQLSTGKGTVTLSRQDLRHTHEAVLWDGRVSTNTSVSDTPGISAAGQLTVDAPRVAAPSVPMTLLEATRLDLEQIQVEEKGDTHIKTMRLEGMRAAAPGEPANGAAAHAPLLDSGDLRVDDIALAVSGTTSIGTIDLSAARFNLERDAHGRFPVLDALSGIAADPDEPARDTDRSEETTSDADTPAIRLGRAELSGDSTLRFRDASVSPAYGTEVRIAEAHISDLDSHHADQPSPFVLDGRLGEHSSIHLEGTTQPFATPPDLDLKGKIDNLEMPPLSPYLAEAIGYDIDSGEMDTDIGLAIRDGNLDGETEFTIHQLGVTPRENQTANGGEGGLTMPLNKALGLVRDKNGTITLSVPISGNLDDPQFSMRDAINQALTKATTTAAVGYLAFALQPYGTLIAVAKVAGDAATRIRLSPVHFEPGSADLPPKAKEYLQKVATVLQDRKGVSVQVCGVATPSDRNALQTASDGSAAREAPNRDGGNKEGARVPVKTPPPVTDEELHSLAQQRATAVESYLVKRFGADPGRLVSCRDKLDRTDNGVPRVDLLI